jgi:hypothetical protein
MYTEGMCFSAPASFIASGVLATAGGVSLAIAPKKQKIIAAIPLLFAVQQVLEGFQWLSLRGGTANMFAGYGFLLFAFVLWPIYIPAAVYILDRRSHRAIRWLIVLGLAVGGFLGWVLLTRPLTVGILGRCIEYRINIPFVMLVTLAYVLATCGALLLSRRRAFRILGITTFAALVITAVFFYDTATSVWCFFAALLSVLILFYLEYRKK